MTTRVEKTVKSGELQPFSVNVRAKISALWTALLFVFAYLDIFSLYRPDFRAEIEAGKISGFTIGETFLVAVTAYVVIPSLMVFGVLVMAPRINRIANVALSLVYALTIVAGAIGEWNYYVFGSVIEIALLAAIAYHAWTWPKLAAPSTTSESETPTERHHPATR